MGWELKDEDQFSRWKRGRRIFPKETTHAKEQKEKDHSISGNCWVDDKVLKIAWNLARLQGRCYRSFEQGDEITLFEV